MRVLVAGAAGFLGTAIVAAIVEGGGEAVGLVRGPAGAERVRAVGGRPELGDVLDPGPLARAADGCEAIVHVAAAQSAPDRPPGYPEWVRVEGARNLARVARDRRVARLVVGSGYWVYASQPGPITEESPTDPQGESRINFDAEGAAAAELRESSVEVVVARPAMVYGDGAWFRPVVDAVRDGSYRWIDRGENAWSFVSLRDTASAFVLLCERGRAGSVYNVADGRPAPWREFIDLVAERTGRPSPGGMTLEAARETFGDAVAHHLMANRPLDVARLRGLGWRPADPDYRTGVPPLLERMVGDRGA